MTDKIALITGASRGLGAALAQELCTTHHIVAVARTTGALEALDDQIKRRGGQAVLAPMDIIQSEAMSHLCRSLYDRWEKIDLWLHTAIHAAPLTPAATLDAKDWDKSVSTNIKATGNLIPLLAPLLGDSGQAVFFDDPKAGQKFFSAYGASKAAQMALAYSWQAETAKFGPKVTITAPKPMPTATRARFYPGERSDNLSTPMEEARRIIKTLDLQA